MSGITSLTARVPGRPLLATLLSVCIGLIAIGPATGQFEAGPAGPGTIPLAAAAVDHLVVSELVTGGAGASDEFVEIYNPTAAAVPLEGLELAYLSASGATATRKASWAAGAPSLGPGSHWLIANSAGIFAFQANSTYANGIAATGGSVVLRVQGATAAIDAVSWGTAASGWLEGSPAPAPVAGSSLERLPGGIAGSWQDTDDNLVDFVIRDTPDPQNASAAPIDTPTPSASASGVVSPTPNESASQSELATPSESASPVPSAPASPSDSPATTAGSTGSPSATPSSTPTPSPTLPPSPAPTPAVAITIAEARSLPDGATATIRAVALTSSDFTDGGGCVADATGAIAVLLSSGSFARGEGLLVTGLLDDRYAQRTLRSSSEGFSPEGQGLEPAALATQTGGIGEVTECEPVRLSARLVGGPTSLVSGLAFEVDDGSGSVRVLVAPPTGINTSGWVDGAQLSLIGVAGQRDSSGTGIAGYRVMPRDAADILVVQPPATPSPSPTPSASRSSSTTTPTARPSLTPTRSPSSTTGPGAVQPPRIDVRQARSAQLGTVVRVRGVVTMGNGIIDTPTAVIQDASAAIVLRLGEKAGRLRRGRLVEVVGVRSSKAGMATIRVDKSALVIGTAAEPPARRIKTGAAAEGLEARVVIVRGAVTSKPVRSSAGNVALTLDDGSGALRVTLFSQAGIPILGLARGAFAEVRGVLGQQTTSQQPAHGYRLWPRGAGDLSFIAASSSASNGSPASDASAAGSSKGSPRAATGAGLLRLADDASSGAAGLGSSSAKASDATARGHRAGGASAASGAAGQSVTPGGSNDPRSTDAGSSSRSSGVLSQRYAATLGLTALALLVLFGVLAWRSGTLQRVRLAVERAIGSAGLPQAPADPVEPWERGSG